MDNQPEFSAVEPLAEHLAEPQNRPVPPAGTEWGAVGMGLAVGGAWWIAQTLFWQFFYRYVGMNYGTSVFSSSWFVVFGKVIQFASPLAYGTVIGFAIGYRARLHIYKNAAITITLLFIFTSCLTWYTLSRLQIAASVFTPSYFMWTAFSFVLSMAAALNGAYLAQSVKRNRGVRIQ